MNESRAQEIADDLIGTAQSLHDAMTDAEIEDDVLRDELNTLCFECDRCGWWASSDELHNESGMELCDECNEDIKDD